MTSDRSETGAPSQLWVEAWRADVAEPLRVRRAHRRFLASRSVAESVGARVTPLHAARWVALGVVLGTGSLLAATRVAAWLAPDAGIAPVPSSNAVAPARAGSRKNTPPRSIPPSSREASVALPPVPSVRPRALGEASEPELWQRAARSLRDKDFDAADATLEELMREGSPSDKESARLVQAQVLLARGRTQAAEQLLHELAATAHSPKVRQKSLELLSMQKELPSDRSFPVEEGANEP